MPERDKNVPEEDIPIAIASHLHHLRKALIKLPDIITVVNGCSHTMACSRYSLSLPANEVPSLLANFKEGLVVMKSPIAVTEGNL
jgi:hypothetical protein